MLCLRNEPCHKDTLFCCYSCEVTCGTKNDCNDDDCINNPNNIINKKEQETKQKEDIKWLLEEVLKAGRYADVDFEKITDVAKRNGYAIDNDLDLTEVV